MAERSLFNFVIKRVIFYYLLLTIADIVLMTQKWPILAGLTAGGIIGTVRFGTTASMFGRIPFISGKKDRKSFSSVGKQMVFVINQVILLPLLYFSYKAGMAFFGGIAAGILLVPLVLLINSITEVLKITHNNFE